VLAFPILAAPGGSSAEPPENAPSKAALDAARAKLHQMSAELSALVEQYNEAKWKLEQITADLTRAQEQVDATSQKAEDARSVLQERVANAYTLGPGGRLEALFGAGSITDFSDRMHYLSAIAEEDQRLALTASNATVLAQQAEEDLQRAREAQQEEEEKLKAATESIQKNIAEQKALVEKYQIQYKEALAAAREEARREAQQAAPEPTGDGGGGGGGGEGNYNPPPASSAAEVAVQVALDQVGDEYQWGAAGPDEFDCSGLVVYSYGKAGISLPHSSSALYASLPKVSKSQLQRGDLVFFYNPIHHVGIYLGDGTMVHAFSEGSPVGIDPVFSGYYGSKYVGAARPG
jgi:cell wall-associated NlpC family hydrolase